MRLTWNRRGFLTFLGASAGGAVLGLQTWSCSDSSEEHGTDPDRTSLSRAELDRASAFAAALFHPEGEQEARELDTVVRWWATGRTTRGPHLELYRDGLAALAARNTRDDKDSVSTTSDRITALRNELLEGIYSSSVGWKSLGYTTWPSVPSGSLRYTTRPPSRARVVRIPIAEIFG